MSLVETAVKHWFQILGLWHWSR